MRCAACHAEDTRVIDSRVIEDGAAIRRRRACEKCSFRFTTLEELEILQLTVRKADGSEEPYNKEKLAQSLRIALQKRPAANTAALKKTVNRIEQEIQTKAHDNRISTQEIGEIVMKHLRKLDKVAYVRFASVYRSFEDIAEFADELEKLGTKKRKPIKKSKQ
ncbi:MAG: transcriptional regulator NrdR [Candidatus Kerfeldbacteria bacterium]